MKASVHWIIVCLTLGFQSAQAAETNAPPRFTVELRDGSRVVGESTERNLKFHSALVGDIKLAVKSIRSIECISTNSARLTTVNGDTLTVSFGDSELAVNTSFGKVKLAVGLLQKVSVSARRAATNRAGLVALWSAEDNVNDTIGGNNGSAAIGISYANGVVGRAFKFDGSREEGVGYIPVPASTSLDIGRGDGLTIECWIKPDHLGPPGAEGIPIVEWDSAESNEMGLWVENGFRLFAAIKDESGRFHIVESELGLVRPGQFQQVAFAYDKGTGMAALYINGEEVTSTYFGNITPQTACPLNIGRRTGEVIGRNSTFSGLIDELGLYDRALSPAEIHDEYVAQRPAD